MLKAFANSVNGGEQQLNGDVHPKSSFPPGASNQATSQELTPLLLPTKSIPQEDKATALPPPPVRAPEGVSRKRRSRWDAVEETPQPVAAPAAPAPLLPAVAAPTELPGKTFFECWLYATQCNLKLLLRYTTLFGSKCEAFCLTSPGICVLQAFVSLGLTPSFSIFLVCSKFSRSKTSQLTSNP